jgi:hypothetical protein
MSAVQIEWFGFGVGVGGGLADYPGELTRSPARIAEMQG